LEWANTCVEERLDFVWSLVTIVTLVNDATAAFSDELMHAALAVDGPMFAHAI
jgi:hypothetical protein